MPIQKKATPAYPVKPAKDILSLVLAEQELVFADIETTGFGDFNDITEIGAVRVNIETGKILAKFNTLVRLKIQKKVPQKIELLTGISTKMLEDAPRLEIVLSQFQAFIGSSVISFHNAQFDWPVLQKKFLCIGQQLNNEVICSAKLFRYLHPKQPAGLAAVTEFYGTPIEGHHRAVTDSMWAAACYRRMRGELLSSQDETLTMLAPSAPPSGKPLMLSLEDLQKACIIHRISGWKKGSVSRIYCTTSVADFFYDLSEHVWNVSKRKTEANVSIDTLAQFILGKTNLDLPRFKQTYAPQ